MTKHYKFDTISPKDFQYTNSGTILYRQLIEETIAPHFIMNHYEFSENASTSTIQLPYEQEIYILKGKYKIKKNNGEKEMVMPGDFIFIPARYSYQFESLEEGSFLAVYPKQKDLEENQSEESQELIHSHHSEFEKDEVSSFGSIGTTIQVFLEKSKAPHFIMRRFQMASNGYIGIHNHPWEHEIFLIEGRITLLDSDGNEEIINKNEFIYIPQDEKHGYSSSGKGVAAFICIIPK